MPGGREEYSLTLRVQPGASRDEVVGFEDGVLRVRMRARPHQGRANDAVIHLLAAALGVRRSDVRLARGAASRSKVVTVSGMGEAEVKRRLGG